MSTVRPAGFFSKNIILILIWISESLASPPEITNTMAQIKAVKDKILNGYDKTIRPSAEGVNSILVAFGIIPRQILEVDEERGLFVLDSFLSLAWEDPRLKWNVTTEYDGILQLPADSLWVPNIVIHNSHSTRINPTGDAPLSVLPEGFVTWVPPLHTETSCLTLTHHDVVTCDINIGSRMHDGWEVDVIRDKHLFLKKFFNINPRWELIVSRAKVISHRNSSYEGHLTLKTVFPMKRRIPLEVAVTRRLCLLVMLLTLSIFWLPPNSSKKVLLGGISFLVLTQLLLYVAWSTKYPLTALFTKSSIQSTMYVVVATLLLQVLVIFNLCKITGPVRPPTFVMRFLKGPIGKLACLRLSADINKNIPLDAVNLQEDTAKCTPSPAPRDDWMLLATGLDRLFFLVMSIAMIAIHS